MVDQFYLHEAIDRCAMVAAIAEEHLANHPAVQVHPAARSKISEAVAALHAAYQALAKLSENGSHS